MKKKIVSLICLCALVFASISVAVPVKAYSANEEAASATDAISGNPAVVNDVSAHIIESGEFQVVIDANKYAAKYRLYEMKSGDSSYTLIEESDYPVIYTDSFNETSKYAVTAVSKDGVESEKFVIDGRETANYELQNIFIGKEFVITAGANAAPTSPFNYSNLTDGIIDRDNSANGRFASGWDKPIDGTLELDGLYLLSEMLIYPFNGDMGQLGDNLTVQAYINGEWIDLFFKATNAELAPYFDADEGCLTIDLGRVIAEKVRVYSTTYNKSAGNHYVSLYEIECNGFLIKSAETEGNNPQNIFVGKEFVGAANAAPTSPYNYSNLTDGIIDRYDAANGRFASGWNKPIDGTIELDGRYILSGLRVYAYTKDMGQLGDNFTVQAYNNGEWVDVFYRATNAELAPYFDADEGCIDIDLGGVIAEKVRIYAKPYNITTNHYVSLYEIECSGILVEDYGDYSDNILSGMKFMPTTAAAAFIYNGYASYNYSVLTDGILENFNGRFSTNKEGSAELVFADAIVNLGGEYVLSNIRFYDFVADAKYLGNNFKLEVFSEGKWVTVASYATADEIKTNHRKSTGTGVGESWLEFDLGYMKASAIKFYSETAGDSVSLYEIKCSGYSIESATENILADKEFVPTSDAYNNVFGDNHNTYGYPTLTDVDKSAYTGRFSSKNNTFADATVDLGGEYVLSSIRFHDFVADTNYEALVENYIGNNFKLEVFSNGEWITVASYSTPGEIIANHRIRTGTKGYGQGWLEIGLGNVIASKIRFYSKAVSGTTVSINEIECFGTKANAIDNLWVSSGVTLLNGTASSGTPLTNINDGNLDSYFEANATNSYTVEFDFGGTRALHQLKIYELIDASNLIDGVLATASDNTTVEVYNNGAWKRVASGVSLDATRACNVIDLYGVECSKVRITFTNTRLFDSEAEYRCAKIKEIDFTYNNIHTNRKALLDVYKLIAALNINDIEHSNTVDSFKNAISYVSLTDKEAEAMRSDMQSYYDTTIQDLLNKSQFSIKSSITLGDILSINIYVPKNNLVSLTLDGVEYDIETLSKNTATLDGLEYYRINTPIAGAEGLKELALSVTIDAENNTLTGDFKISIPKYAKKILAGDSEIDKQIVRDVLSYIRASYRYFDSTNTDAIEAIDAIIGARYDETAPHSPEGSTAEPEGLKAASFSLDSTPALRLYLPDGADASRYSFKVNGRLMPHIIATDATGTYAEIDLYAYAMCETVTYLVDGVEGGSYHIASYYEWAKGENNDALVSLVERFWRYAQSARDYKNSVQVEINYTDKNGNTLASSKTLHIAKGAEFSVPSPAVTGFYTRDLYVKGSTDENKVINVVYDVIPENADADVLKEKLSDIVAWGDSITYGALCDDVGAAEQYGIDLVALGSTPEGATYVDVLKNLIASRVYSGIDVANCGVGSDTTCQIAARANTETNYLYLGSDMTVSNSSVVIPLMHMAEYGRLGILRKDIKDTTSNVSITGKDENGNEVTVTGKITSALSPSAPSGTNIKTCDYSLIVYTFTRTDGKTNTVNFTSGTRVETQESYIFDGRTCIIFMGENGGYNNDLDKLIEQQEEILAACGNPEYFLIISSTSQSTEIRKPITDALTERWGVNYINMGNELSSSRSSYEFAGYSEEDIVSIQDNIIDGTVSTLLIKDSCHPNAVGYAVAGNIIFERLFDLGVFNDIFDYYDSLNS